MFDFPPAMVGAPLRDEEKRHTAYFYQTAEDISATRAKWSDTAERLTTERAKLPALEERIRVSKLEYEKVKH